MNEHDANVLRIQSRQDRTKAAVRDSWQVMSTQELAILGRSLIDKPELVLVYWEAAALCMATMILDEIDRRITEGTA